MMALTALGKLGAMPEAWTAIKRPWPLLHSCVLLILRLRQILSTNLLHFVTQIRNLTPRTRQHNPAQSSTIQHLDGLDLDFPLISGPILGQGSLLSGRSSAASPRMLDP